MLRRLGIRAKVMAVLAVPMLVLFGAGAYISNEALREAGEVRAAEGVMAALQAYAPLAGAIEAERMLSLNGGTAEQINAARIASDDALRDVFPLTRALNLDAFPAAVVAQFRDVQFAHNEMLPSARHLVDINGHREEIARYYNTIITGQISLMESVANALPNRDLARYVTAYREVATTSDGLVSELIDAIALIKTRVSLQTTALAYANETAANEISRHRARDAVDGLGLDGVELNPDDPSYLFTNIRSDLSQGNVRAFETVDMQAYAKDIQDQLLSLSSVNDKILGEAHAIATKAADDAQNRAILTIGLAVAAAVASLFFALVIARGIVTPLRRLTAAAANVREQLPRLVEQVAVPGEGPEITLEPIPVTTKDEVGELAQAFNSVNATTVQVAQEQAALRGSIAEMFVNVARRDQVLLNRQLSFIDSLERAEEDPSTLANLFRLDHLATRMRRNAESLLVLAGIDSGRRLRDAMPLSDVIRTASSEIEQYDRVELDLQVDPAMLGFNALGAAHMLAELLENATVFSEPETPVIVTTGVVGQYVVVRVLDQGLGMSDAELETANTRIKSTGASDALGAQRLGLFVVGRIAQRLGADVYLGKSPRGTGTETIVRFPASLFAANEQSLYGSPIPAASAAPSIAADAFQPPVVEEVNLAALTDGSTALGLPRRRRGDDGAEVDTNADGVPGVAPALGRSELPARPSKTFDLDKIVLPEAPSGNISADLTTDSSEWKPPTIAAEPLKNTGLPSRTRAATSAWAQPAEETPTASAPAPAARAGLFSGFRGRGDIQPGTPAGGTPIPGLAPDDDRQAPDAVRAPWMSLGAHSATPEPIVVPSLVEDDEQTWEPEQADAVQDEAPAAEQTVSEQAAAEAEPVEAWAPTQPSEAAWAAAEAEPAEAWAPTQPSEPAWAPSEPTHTAEVDEPAWAPSAPEQHEVATAAAAVADEPWAPVEDWATPAQHEEPVWAPRAAAEPVDEPVAEEQWAPQAAAPVDERADEPVAAELAHRVSPLDDSPMFDTVLHEAAATEHVEEPVEEPVAELPAVVEPSPVLPTRRSTAAAAAEAPAADAPAAFTSYSGYSGWAGAVSQDAHVALSTPHVPFERTLDEARAWHTGAMPVVPEPAAAVEEQAAEEQAADGQQADDAWPTPAWEAPAWQPPTWQAPEHQQADQAAESVEAPSARTDETTTFAPVIPQLVPDEEPETWNAPAAEAWPTLEPDPEPAPVEQAEHHAEAAPYAPASYAQAPAPYAPPFAQAPAPYAQAPAPYAPAPASFAQAPAPFAQAPAPVAPAQVAPAPVAPAPVVPAPVQSAQAWASAPAPEQAFSDLVNAGEDERPKRRWGGLFGKRKGDETASAATPAVAPAAPAPADAVSPPRTSAWSNEQPAPVADQAPPSWSAPSWSAPSAPAASTPPAPAPVPAAPAPLEQRSAGSWSPPEWAARPAAAGAPVSTVPHPNVPPSVAPRIGTLDDEVAAMLALRSDIQEQALSELSQLSAYRPSAVGGSAEQLTRRVPSAIPTTPVSADEGKPVQRDADELRSRLSSFQSGTSRGRRASGDPSPEQNGPA